MNINTSGFHEIFRQQGHTNMGWSLIRTPGLVPFGTCIIMLYLLNAVPFRTYDFPDFVLQIAQSTWRSNPLATLTVNEIPLTIFTLFYQSILISCICYIFFIYIYIYIWINICNNSCMKLILIRCVIELHVAVRQNLLFFYQCRCYLLSFKKNFVWTN